MTSMWRTHCKQQKPNAAAQRDGVGGTKRRQRNESKSSGDEGFTLRTFLRPIAAWMLME
jgi:hypothetical protein